MRSLHASYKFVAFAICLLAIPATSAEDAEPRGEGRYLVKFRTAGNARLAIDAVGGRLARALENGRVAAAYLPEAALGRLRNNPNVEYIEADPRRLPMAQAVPYGIGMVQADDPALSASNATVGSTVCIIDSGYYQSHEDLQDANVSGTNDAGTGNWYEDSCGHGTHVAGTVSALDNTVGVVGVNRSGMLGIHIEKVFDGSACGWAYSSDLIAALDRCQQAVSGTGQKLVVNMSLSGTAPSAIEESAFQVAWDAGVLPVAAASNGGGTTTAYPAGYASVISVAAVDSNGAVASFSQRNADVELAAPGVGVLSTSPFRVSSLNADGEAWPGANIQGSARLDASGTLVDGGICDTVGAWTGQVVLCQRGTITFARKVANVEAGGGAGVAIYNNAAGSFTGTLNGTSAIPAIGLSQADGAAALAHVAAYSTLANSAGAGSSYVAKDGTSMATPHVAGIAALLWSFYPAKTNAEIRTALQTTAQDRGTAGRDNSYGFGIVQAKAAYNLLGGIEPPPPPPPPTITLTVTKVTANGKRYARLRWSGVTGTQVNYYRNSTKFTTANDGVQRDGPLARGSFAYRVCKLNSSDCSPQVTIVY
jgi:subtilisin family serine protease